MPTQTTNFNLDKPIDGGDKDTWGAFLNTDLDKIDALIQQQGGTASVAHDNTATFTLVDTDYNSPAKNRNITVTGALTASRELLLPAREGTWVIRNATTGGFDLVVKQATGSTITVKAGERSLLYSPSGSGLIHAVSNIADLYMSGNLEIYNGTPTATFKETDDANETAVLKRSAGAFYIQNTDGIRFEGNAGVDLPVGAFLRRLGSAYQDVLSRRVDSNTNLNGLAAFDVIDLSGFSGILALSLSAARHASGTAQALQIQGSGDGGTTWTSLLFNGFRAAQSVNGVGYNSSSSTATFTDTVIASGEDVFLDLLITKMGLSFQTGLQFVARRATTEVWVGGGTANNAQLQLRLRWSGAVNFTQGSVAALVF